MVSANLYIHGHPASPLHSYPPTAATTKMDSVIDFSDASRALDLARIRAQLM